MIQHVFQFDVWNSLNYNKNPKLRISRNEISDFYVFDTDFSTIVKGFNEKVLRRTFIRLNELRVTSFL